MTSWNVPRTDVNTIENLNKSGKILWSMFGNVTTNKLLLSIVILLELAVPGRPGLLQVLLQVLNFPQGMVRGPEL